MSEATAESTTTMRKVSRFSWGKVPDETLVAMVVAVGLANDDEVAAAVRSYDRTLLEEVVAAELGTPPKERFLSVLMPALMDKWLDEAADSSVDALYEIIRARLPAPKRRRRIDGRAAQIAFLRERNRTQQFMKIVRKAFVAACKERVEVPSERRPHDERRGPIHLEGHDDERAYPLYDHQTQAIGRLDALLDDASDLPVSSMVVLPTGAGKTDTLVEWTLGRLEREPRLRVLWIAHQQELLDQAAGRYLAASRLRPQGFRRELRIIHGAASPPSALGAPDVDIVAASIQSLNVWRDTAKRRVLRAFLRRPTIVVVDEAHHAGAPGYERVLDELAKSSNLHAVIGLTATPRPTAPRARASIRKRFGDKPLIKVEKEPLVEQQILARRILTTVETRQVITVTGAQARQAVRSDFAPEVLREVATKERDELVVRTWLKNKEGWGRTLVFATDIKHAESLTGRFGAQARALHSKVLEDRKAILDWFRATEDAVLVSVGMLTEGVDLPAARTAFLARPTASSVLLEQMQGRVLRGPKAGGGREANVVYFHDLWRNFADVADPRDTDAVGDTWGRRKRILGRLVPIDIVGALEDLFRREGLAGDGAESDDEDADNDDASNELPDPHLVTSRLVGYYELGDDERSVPVLDHHAEGFAAMIDAKLDPKRRRMPNLMSFFEGAHMPLPSERAIIGVLNYIEEFEEAPSFVSIDAAIGPALAADEVYAAGDGATEGEVAEIIRRHFEETLAGVWSPTLDAFDEAVRREVREIKAKGGRRGPEVPILPPTSRDAKPIPRTDERALKPILARVAERGKALLPPSVLALLGDDLPRVDWTPKVETVALGKWTIELRSRAHRGEQAIRINRVLKAPPDVISDELLEFLIWHELLHHLLPGQGHDAQFRELEMRWPRAPELDHEIDTLHERFDMRRKSYESR